ncbi:MAG TPA: hypothetical protein VMW48_13995 [Vicinamibacterales bacterium]|nr:hypothetical protein [Vicinamibacterales bacterium]
MGNVIIEDVDGKLYVADPDNVTWPAGAISCTDGIVEAAAGVDATDLGDKVLLLEDHAAVSQWKSRSGSRSGSGSRYESRASMSRSMSRSLSTSRHGSRSGSRSNSRSQYRSRASMSRSASRSNSASQSRHQSASASRSASRSLSRSVSGSRHESRSASRSVSGSRSRSGSRSQSGSRSVSGSGSRSGSRSQSGSRSGSRSNSRSQSAPAACPTDDCLACDSAYAVDLDFSTCDTGPFTGTIDFDAQTDCSWTIGLGGTEELIDGNGNTLRTDPVSGIHCAFAYWIMDFDIIDDVAMPMGWATYKRAATGNGDCANGTYSKITSGCDSGADTWPAEGTVYT